MEQGYLALNMRDLAADAGISPATLYAYFATKEELFATLFAEAFEVHTTTRIRPICAAADDVERLLVDVITAYLDLYRDYGRHFTLWSALRDDADPKQAPFPQALTTGLRDAFVAQATLVQEALHRVSGGRIAADVLAATFLWTSINGLVDHLASERRLLDPFEGEELIAFAAARLATSLM